MLVAANHAVGFTLYSRGDLTGALARAEAGTALFDEDTEQKLVRKFQFSSTTALYSFAAASLWMTGREKEADVALERALSLPKKFMHPPSIVFSLAFNALMLMHRRDWSRVHDQSARAVSLSKEEGFKMWLPFGQVLMGLCEAAGGQLEKGLAATFEAFDLFAATGTGVCQSQIHAPLGEFLIEAGRSEEAVRRVTASIDSALRRDECVYLSELYRVRGLAQRNLGALEHARADIANACDIARSQGAITLLQRAEESRRTISI